jgi:hypothetical protein
MRHDLALVAEFEARMAPVWAAGIAAAEQVAASLAAQAFAVAGQQVSDRRK